MPFNAVNLKLKRDKTRRLLRHASKMQRWIYCRSNYDSTSERYKIYCFPSDKEDLERWLSIHPNRLTKITKNMGVCEKHWPTDVPMSDSLRYPRPLLPPSIFPDCPPAVLRPRPSKARDVEERLVSSTARSSKSDEWDDYMAIDKVEASSWDEFVSKMRDQAKHLNLFLAISPDEEEVRLHYSSVSAIRRKSTCVQIKSNFAVKVSTGTARDLLGFQH